MRTRILSLASILATTCFLILLPDGSPLRAQDSIPVNCPGFGRAISMENGPPGFASVPPTLVVLGTAKKDGNESHDYGKFQLKIEKVLYGHYDGDTVVFQNMWNWEGRNIYFLSPVPYKGPVEYEWYDEMDADELPAAQALCDNRFDGTVLSAATVFVGTEVPHGPPPSPLAGLPIAPGTTVRVIGGGGEWDDYKHEIKVVRQLSGPPMKTGESVSVLFANFIRVSGGAETFAHPEERVYCVLGPLKENIDGRTSYTALTAFPIALEDRVKQTLARRDSYPVEEEKSHPGEKYRNILFQGTVDEAVSFLSARSPAAVNLAEQYFLHHVDESRKALVAKVAAGMFTPTTEGPVSREQFRTQLRYIDALDAIEKKSASGALPALIDEMIAKLEKETPSFPMPKRGEENIMTGEGPWGHSTRIPEEQTMDINHSLSWLMLRVGEKEASRRWAARLLALQPRLNEYWRHEVDLAITTSRIVQNSDMSALLAKMDGVKPLHADPVFAPAPPEIRKLAISPDGKYLALSGPGNTTRIVDFASWKILATIRSPSGDMAFSPDGNFLYLRGPKAHTLFTRYEWRTGKADKSYDYNGNWIDRMLLSHDGATMVTACFQDEKILVWDTASGKVIKTIALPKEGYVAGLSPDGKKIVYPFATHGDPYRTDGIDLAVEPVQGDASPSLKVACDCDVSKVCFTPDGRYLVAAGGFGMEKMRVLVSDLADGGKIVASVDEKGRFPSAIAVSPSGKYLAVSGGDSGMRLYEFPSLKPLGFVAFAENLGAADLAFTVDEKMLVLACVGDVHPSFVSMETFKEITPFVGDAGFFMGVYFSPDGGTVSTFGAQGTICHRKADSLELVDRAELPPESHLLGISPDGRYALTIPRAAPPSPSSSALCTVKIIDTKTGAEKSLFKISVGYWCPVYWTSDSVALIFGHEGQSLTRLDCANSKILGQYPLDTKKVGERDDLYLAADGKSLICHDDFLLTNPWYRLSLPSGDVQQVPGAKSKVPSLQIDGMSYSLLAQGFSQKNLPQVPQLPPLVKMEEAHPSLFSPAKHRLVRIVYDQIPPEAGDATPADGSSANRVPGAMAIGYDTTSMTPVFAFRLSGGFDLANIDADANRLVVTNYDGSIEIWPLRW